MVTNHRKLKAKSVPFPKVSRREIQDNSAKNYLVCFFLKKEGPAPGPKTGTDPAKAANGNGERWGEELDNKLRFALELCVYLPSFVMNCPPQ